jgi:hypothetical protein
MANDKQLTLSDIKGDLAQRLGCASCTRKFNQVKAVRVELDRYETKEPNAKKAYTFICEQCNKEGRAPVYAYRMVGTGGIVNEIRIEDLPESRSPATAATKATRATRGKRGGRKGTRASRKTTPTEAPTAEGARQAAQPAAAIVEKE